MSTKLIFKQLAVHNDLALGVGTILQQRGPILAQEQRIELSFIFRSINEIRALDITRYTRVQLHQPGCTDEYWYDETSEAVDDDILVLRPDIIPVSEPGRWLYVNCNGGVSVDSFDGEDCYCFALCPAAITIAEGQVLKFDSVVNGQDIWCPDWIYPDGEADQALVRVSDDDDDVEFRDVGLMPDAGTTTQRLVKASDDDFDTEWVDRDSQVFVQLDEPTAIAGDGWLVSA